MLCLLCGWRTQFGPPCYAVLFTSPIDSAIYGLLVWGWLLKDFQVRNPFGARRFSVFREWGVSQTSPCNSVLSTAWNKEPSPFREPLSHFRKSPPFNCAMSQINPVHFTRCSCKMHFITPTPTPRPSAHRYPELSLSSRFSALGYGSVME